MKQKSKKDWYVLCTKPRQELKILEHLSHLGIETYAPTKIVVKNWSDRKKRVKTCLFPSMVLVRLPKDEVNIVFEVSGVKRYLFVHGVRAVVYDHEVISMKHYLENKFEVHEKSKIEVGNHIDIPTLKQQAEILAVKGKKCLVKLQLLGATMSFNLN